MKQFTFDNPLKQGGKITVYAETEEAAKKRFEKFLASEDRVVFEEVAEITLF